MALLPCTSRSLKMEDKGCLEGRKYKFLQSRDWQLECRCIVWEKKDKLCVLLKVG
jgi:hypothetical protein